MADTFIELRKELLPEKEGHDLLIWLGKSESRIMTRIVESSVREHLAAATNAALRSQEAPLKMSLADESLKRAQRYMTFLEVLKEIKDHTGRFVLTAWVNR
jgi:hypothetical protein